MIEAPAGSTRGRLSCMLRIIRPRPAATNPMSPNPRKPVFVAIVPMRWGDLDAYGHVNNILYFQYAEQARSEWMCSLLGDTRHPGQGMVVAHQHCDYKRPLGYPGIVEVHLSVDPPGRSSLTIWFEIRKSGEDVLYAAGNARMVWMDLAAGRSMPLPDRVRGATVPQLQIEGESR